jgi:hypothetical protein
MFSSLLWIWGLDAEPYCNTLVLSRTLLIVAVIMNNKSSFDQEGDHHFQESIRYHVIAIMQKELWRCGLRRVVHPSCTVLASRSTCTRHWLSSRWTSWEYNTSIFRCDFLWTPHGVTKTEPKINRLFALAGTWILGSNFLYGHRLSILNTSFQIWNRHFRTFDVATYVLVYS